MNQHPNYLMWMKNNYIANSHYQIPMMSSFNNSWDEQTFADDVAFIWPPRSYSCSFCKRKFRSAQALGGHMNVHRRDRARLKLSLDSQNDDPSLPSFNLNPNPSPNHDPNFLSLSQSPRMISKSKTINARKEDFRLRGEDDEANLSIGLHLKISENRSCAFEYNEGINNPKRLKTNDLKLPFFLEPHSKERLDQGLDLELRLGDSPKFK